MYFDVSILRIWHVGIHYIISICTHKAESPQYLCKHLHVPRNKKDKPIDTCFHMAHVCAIWCWRSPRWWSKQAVSDLTMYVVILGGQKMHPNVGSHDGCCFFFKRRFHSKQPGQLGFQRDLLGMLGFGCRGVFQPVEASLLGSNVAKLYTSLASVYIDSCNLYRYIMIICTYIYRYVWFICVYLQYIQTPCIYIYWWLFAYIYIHGMKRFLAWVVFYIYLFQKHTHPSNSGVC